MNVEKCAFVECPNCEEYTPVPMLIHDYDWKNAKYTTAQHEWRCVHCGESFTVQAVRGITEIGVEK